MAIRFEFCNVVVSVNEIETKFPGGLREYEKLDPSGLSWHDGVILRLGSMGGDIPTVDILEKYGIQIYDFRTPLPKGWFIYDASSHEIISSVNPNGYCGAFMWTDQAPCKPDYYGGRFWQGGFVFPNLKNWSLFQRCLYEQDLLAIRTQHQELREGYLDLTLESDHVRYSDEIRKAIQYIGIEPSDFALSSASFLRRSISPIHGVSHIYRVMIAVALIAQLVQKPREGLLAFCAAYIHDLARLNDGNDPEHGLRASKLISQYAYLWDKYLLSSEELEYVQFAITFHNMRNETSLQDSKGRVVSLLKDADTLDRVRFRNANARPKLRWMRYDVSRGLVDKMEEIYRRTCHIDFIDIPVNFQRFIALLK